MLRCTTAETFTVLAPFERKGYELVGLKSRGGGAVIAFRASPSAVVAGRAIVAKLLPTLPVGATLVASRDQPLSLIHI